MPWPLFFWLKYLCCKTEYLFEHAPYPSGYTPANNPKCSSCLPPPKDMQQSWTEISRQIIEYSALPVVASKKKHDQNEPTPLNPFAQPLPPDRSACENSRNTNVACRPPDRPRSLFPLGPHKHQNTPLLDDTKKLRPVIEVKCSICPSRSFFRRKTRETQGEPFYHAEKSPAGRTSEQKERKSREYPSDSRRSTPMQMSDHVCRPKMLTQNAQSKIKTASSFEDGSTCPQVLSLSYYKQQ